MGACARRTKRVVKAVAKQLAPEGIKIIGTVVGALADAKISNQEKRAVAVQVGQAVTDAKEWAVRAAVEAAVGALKDGEEKLREFSEVGQADQDEIDKDD